MSETSEETNNFEKYFEAVVEEVAAALEEKKGKVVLHNDDHNLQTAVTAAVAGVIRWSDAGVDPAEDPDEVSRKVLDEARYRVLHAERQGHAVIFEGPLVECDLVQRQMTRSDVDAEWVFSLASVDPHLVPALIVQGVRVGLADADDALEIVSNFLYRETLDERFVEFICDAVPRPRLRVEVIPDEGPQ